MINCEWIKTEDNKYVCKLCGKKVPIPGKMNCPSKKDIPNIIQRVKNFGKAVAHHISTGSKHCTDEQKQARFDKCKSNECGLFRVHGDGGICAHDDCGCFIRSNGQFLDKLSWADSKCPVGLWGPENIGEKTDIEIQNNSKSPKSGV